MRRTLIFAMACAAGFGSTARVSRATTLSMGDAFYAGHIGAGVPSSERWQSFHVNTLIRFPAGQPDTPVGRETYNREGSTLMSLPAAFPDGSERDETEAHGGIDVAGFSYIVAKYGGRRPGAGVFVWYVSGLTSVDLPQHSPGGYELSHHALFAGGLGGRRSVPDPGATLVMLGGSLAGLEALRRRFRA